MKYRHQNTLAYFGVTLKGKEEFSAWNLGATTITMMTIIIMTLSIATLSTMVLFATLGIYDTQNDTQN
jgi:hypothetical protein